MSYTALYRKWRPASFEDVRGQDHVVQTLKTRLYPTVSDMHICSAVPEVPVRPVLQRYLQKRLTVRARWTAVPAENAGRVRTSRQALP